MKALVVIAALLAFPGSVRAETGSATWYCSDGRDGSDKSRCTHGYGPDSLVAAIDTRDTPYRRGDRVRVSGPAGEVVVRIVDNCACKVGRIIDLPIGPFEKVAGDWRVGEVPVSVVRVGSTPIAPATDTEDQAIDWPSGITGGGPIGVPDPYAFWKALLVGLLGLRLIALVRLAFRPR